MTSEFCFIRYLASKKTVDNRSLNRPVWDTLAREVAARSKQGPLKILELGCGIGTMIERCMDWGLFARADYTAIDSQQENIREAEIRLRQWAGAGAGITFHRSNGSCHVKSLNMDVAVRLDTQDVLEFVESQDQQGRYDLLIANAFLDLLHLPRVLPKILGLLKPNGLFYFSINFDGVSAFEPPLDADLDEKVERAYHQTMDERLIDGKPSGDYKTGRRLFHLLANFGVKVIEAGSSDWVVFPRPEGYIADEAYFLKFIIDTVRSALENSGKIEKDELTLWVETRQKQIQENQLVYIAHQLDLLGVADNTSA